MGRICPHVESVLDMGNQETGRYVLRIGEYSLDDNGGVGRNGVDQFPGNRIVFPEFFGIFSGV